MQYAGASTTVADQQAQITAMVTKGAKVIVIGATDAAQLSTQVAAATQAGAKVIAYDRLITNTPDLDYYVAFDNFKVGQLQGQALLDGMKAKKPNGPYNIELFSGSPDDNNAGVFFNGAMSVLKPEIDKGNVVVASSQTDVKQTAIQGWKAEGAQARMDPLLTSTYGSKDARRRPLPERHAGPRDHHLDQGCRQAGPGRHRPGLRGRVGQVDHGRRAVLDDQQGHPEPGQARPSTWSRPCRPVTSPEVNDTKSYNNGSKVVDIVPAPAGHRDQGERGRGVRQRPEARAAHQVSTAG